MGKSRRIVWSAVMAALPVAGIAPAVAQDVYRAGSSDPYWRVGIDARTIRFEEPGRRPVVVPRPVATTSAGGDRFDGDGLVVDTTRAGCSLGDSDRVYRDMVIVEVGGRTLRGCGNGATGAQINAMKVPAAAAAKRTDRTVAATPPAPPRPAAPVTRPTLSGPTAPVPAPPQSTAATFGKTRPALANTRWTVWKVRGQEIKAPQPLIVSFTADEVSGKLCNSFRGRYTLTGERLQAASLASTRMACQGATSAAEQMLFPMLRSATRATISKWGTLTLGDGMQSIMLRPVR